MAQRPWNSVLQHIRSLVARHDNPACDAELLRQFVSHHDEAAFEALLRRHGPMVLRVARRTVGNATDAEDVFQATFLLLARRAAAIRKRESVASWLHGVAHRLALSARSKRVRRQLREREAAAARLAESPSESAWSELEETLHEVLAQLPAKYRTPLIYCYLEGWTQEEVARQLGKPLGTVRSWLARGRELLRKRLVRRGISLSSEGTSAALLTSACATAEAVPPTLRMATLQAAHLFAKGGNVMTLISPAVADLVKKGMTAILVAKLKSGTVWVLSLALLAAGSGWAAHQRFSAKLPDANETAEKAAPQQAAVEDQPRTDAFGDPLPPGAVARLGTVRFRHEGRLGQFAISPDGRKIAEAGGRSLILWDMATGRPLHRFLFDQFIRCLAFAPDGKSVAVGGEDCIVHQIDLSSGKELQRFAGHQAGSNPIDENKGIRGVAFASDGNKLISWGSDKTVRVWQAKSGKELRQLDPQDLGEKDWHISALSPDGKLLAVSKNEFEKTPLHLWNLEMGKEIRERAYPNATWGVAFSPDSKILALSEADQVRPGRIVLWDLESGKELAASSSQKGWVGGMAFSADGKTLASAGFALTRLGSRIHFWDVDSMKELCVTPTLPSPFSSPPSQLAFSADGKTLVSRGHEAHVRLFDVASGQERTLPEGAPQGIHSLAWSPDAKLATSVFGNKIWFWSAITGKLVRRIECPWHYVSAAAFSGDGKFFVSVSGNGTVCLWDAETGKEQRRMETIKGQFVLAAVSPDGESIALWDHEHPPLIVLWNMRTGKKQRDINVPSETPGKRQSFYTLEFSPDGKCLYACSGTDLRILRWDVASGKELPFFGKHNGGVNGIALSPDGRSIAALSLGGTLYLWETATGRSRLIANDVGFATSIAFSPDGSLLALANSGDSRHITGPPNKIKIVVQGVENREQVRLVRIADGKVIHRFTGHLGGINCVRFSPDGRILASGGQDTTVLLWDVAKLRKEAVNETSALTSEKLGELWKGLLGTAAEAHGCMWTLISAPGQTAPFLREKLKPVAVLDAERFARLLEKLESDQFAQREEATQEMKKLGDAIEPALRKALQEKVPLETRRRLQALLDDLDRGERLRCLRAIEVLERIGDKPARDLLRRLSEGAAGAWLTEEARISLRRLQR